MTKYTVYKAIVEDGIYVRTTTSPLDETDGTVEHLSDVEGDEQAAQFAVCWHLLKMREAGEEALNDDDFVSCDIMMRGITGLAMIEFPALTQWTVEWMLLRYANLKPIGKSRQKVKCGLCGFECEQKNLKNHEGNSRCQARQERDQLTPEELDEAKRAKKQAHLDKQKVKIACRICGFMTAKRHMKRHQESSKCKKPDVDATAEE
jgi:hypothetical protein